MKPFYRIVPAQETDICESCGEYCDSKPGCMTYMVNRGLYAGVAPVLEFYCSATCKEAGE